MYKKKNRQITKYDKTRQLTKNEKNVKLWNKKIIWISYLLLERSESLDFALDRFDLTDLLDLSESDDLVRLILDRCEALDRTEIRDLAESLPLSPNPQPFPNLGVSVRSISFSGLASRESNLRRDVCDLWLPRESVLSLRDLVDLDDLIGLKFDRLRWDLVGLGLLSDPEEAPEKNMYKYCWVRLPNIFFWN